MGFFFFWAYGKTWVSGNHFQFQSPSSVLFNMALNMVTVFWALLPVYCPLPSPLTWTSHIFRFHSVQLLPLAWWTILRARSLLVCCSPFAPPTETSPFLPREWVLSTPWTSFMFVFMFQRHRNFPGMLSALRGFGSQLLSDTHYSVTFSLLLSRCLCFYPLVIRVLWDSLTLVWLEMCPWTLVLLSNCSAHFYKGISRDSKTVVLIPWPPS